MTIKLTIENEDMEHDSQGRVAIVSNVDPEGNMSNTVILGPLEKATVYIHPYSSITISEGV